MIDLTFRLRRPTDDRLVLAFGPAFRIVFAVLAVAIAFGVGVSMSEGEAFSPISLVLWVVLTVGALYEERWEFDARTREITSRHGLIILARKRHWKFEDVEAVEYTHYRAGSVPGSVQETPDDDGLREATGAATSRFAAAAGRGVRRHFLRYSLVLTDGRRLRIELRKIRNWETERTIPAVVAETIGVPLTFSTL